MIAISRRAQYVVSWRRDASGQHEMLTDDAQAASDAASAISLAFPGVTVYVNSPFSEFEYVDGRQVLQPL